MFSFLYLWHLSLFHYKYSQFWVFCSSLFTLKSYRIGLRIKRLSKHPCPEATLPGMNNKWIVFHSKWISWHELLLGYISPIKLYKNLDYLESVIIGWIDLWNYRSCWTLWDDQNIWDSVLKIHFVCVLCTFCMTLGWLDDFLKPQFSSSGSDYAILKKI